MAGSTEGPGDRPAGLFKGNRTYYRVYDVECWLRNLEDGAVEVWQIVAEWLRERYYFPDPLETEERTWRVAEQLRGWNVWQLKHRPRRLTPLAPPPNRDQ